MKQTAMKKLHIPALIFVCLLASNTLAQVSKRDRVISVKTVQGRTVGFEMGDYQHVTIKTRNGPKKSFFIMKPGLDYFLALNKNSQLTLTYEIADVDLPETGGKTRIDRLTSAKAGKVSFESWWKKVSRGNSLEQLDDKYGPLVKKYSLN
jgi:hypothetical protein